MVQGVRTPGAQNSTNIGLAPYIGLATYAVLGLGLLAGWAGDVWPPIAGLALVLAVFNLGLGGFAMRRGSITSFLPAFAVVNTLFCLLVILLTGGHASLFWVLLVINATATSLFLGLVGILMNTGLGAVVLTGSAMLLDAEPLDYVRIAVQLVIVLFVGFVGARAAVLLGNERAEMIAGTMLLDRTVEAQEAERRRLSVDIHDGPLQSLGVSLLTVDRTQRRLERSEYDVVSEELRDLRGQLVAVVGELRSVLAELGQDVLREYGLVAALRSHLERFESETGISGSLTSTVAGRLPADVELLLYRLAQETLTNVRKHSDARTVSIALERTSDDTIAMSITDDGKGFDVEQSLRRYEEGMHIGLPSMRRRIEAAGGELIIVSEPGKGSTLRFICPVGGKR
jgi:signal transduction histidine kinase